VAGLAAAIIDLGHSVEDMGNIIPAPRAQMAHPNPAIHHLAETVAWTEALAETAIAAAMRGFPIFLGGDHSLSLGSVAGIATHAEAIERPLFVLWLDAHTDYHTPQTTVSGNLHGTPVAYIAGREGFAPHFPGFPAPVPSHRIGMLGIRSVDAEERAALLSTDVDIADMRVLDERGIRAPLAEFLDRVRLENGLLHVSLDVDFLDPAIAPAVGTTVPGGATFREAHLVMELLHESELVTSLDLVELNPFLDDRGRTAKLMVELVGSLMGRKVFDRPTRSY
ncbi:MAG TPA: arginase, partial [Paenirhodobacter sp.]